MGANAIESQILNFSYAIFLELIFCKSSIIRVIMLWYNISCHTILFKSILCFQRWVNRCILHEVYLYPTWGIFYKNSSSLNTRSGHLTFLLRNKPWLSRHNLICANSLPRLGNVCSLKNTAGWRIGRFVPPRAAMSFSKQTGYARWKIISEFEEPARKNTHIW